MMQASERVEVVVTVVLELDVREVKAFEDCLLTTSAADALKAWDKAIVEEHVKPKGEVAKWVT